MGNIRPDPDHDAVCASAARHRVVVAPPGTGKTHLAVRLAGVMAATLRAEARVLLLTFSTQARTQLEHEAARQLRPELRGRIEVTNYHRFFWHAVCAYRRALGLPMRIELGSRRRREARLSELDARLVREIGRSEGLLESLVEHAFVEFRDRRTPPLDALERLLAAVTEEHRAGRLIFDDLGGLFWSLLQRFPAVDRAYRDRYPVVIADEHQDASALQDAVARRLGRDRLAIFADPMQLIHGFRGASPERLDRHQTECDGFFTLGHPHRWHGNEPVAEWLIAVRARLTGNRSPANAPAELTIDYTAANRGFNAVKPRARFAVLRAFREGCESVAVLARSNRDVADLRQYLSQQGLKPWQIGGEDFEEARAEIEDLPLLRDPQSIAFHALDRLAVLVSTLERRVVEQARGRLGAAGTNVRGAAPEVAAIVRALEPVYQGGAARYFEVMICALDACAALGHHLPRLGAVRALRETADAFSGSPAGLDELLERYSARVVAATHAAPRLTRGLFVMTAHQAKGKEFDAVIVANASEQFFPDDDESRRLFYVAITRATRRWTVIAPDRGASPLLAAL